MEYLKVMVIFLSGNGIKGFDNIFNIASRKNLCERGVSPKFLSETLKI